MITAVTKVVAAGRCGQDVAKEFPYAGGTVLVVADGAGGTGGGKEAAETLVMWAASSVEGGRDLDDRTTWCELLASVDYQLASAAGGQTTAVIANVIEAGIVGASVGDSAAWVIGPDGRVNLTADQNRKPLIGSGGAQPVGFAAGPLAGTLLLASDGLVNYASHETICAAARGANLEAAATDLVDLVRLQSGALPDDVAVILARRAVGEMKGR